MKNQIISIIVATVVAVFVSVTVTRSLTSLQIDMELQEAYGGLVNRINALDQSNDDTYQELNKVYQSLDAITYDESIDELASRTKDLEESVSTLEDSVISLDDRVSLLIRPLVIEEPTLVVVEESIPIVVEEATPIVVEEVIKEPTREPTFLSCVDDRLSKPSNKALIRSLEKARSIGTFEFNVVYNVAFDGDVNNIRITTTGIPIDIKRVATRYINKFEYASADVGVNDCVYAMRLIVQQ